MISTVNRFINAISWRITHLAKCFEKTYEQQILYELRGKKRLEHKTAPIKFYDWTIYSHDIGLIYAGINYQFSEQINDFYTDKTDPIILDCGTNIGMSVLRYKQLYPKARIIAFEPDPIIFASLKKNIVENKLEDVELVQAAVWIAEDELAFSSDNYDGGFLSAQTKTNREQHPNTSIISVPTIDLREYLDQPIDFLKMDIEGAEYKVLTHCADLLHNVDKLVVEVHYHVDEVYFLTKILDILETAEFKVSLVSPLERESKIDLRVPFVRNPKMNADIYIAIYAWH